MADGENVMWKIEAANGSTGFVRAVDCRRAKKRAAQLGFRDLVFVGRVIEDPEGDRQRCVQAYRDHPEMFP